MYYNLRSVTNRMLFSSYICICLSRRLPLAVCHFNCCYINPNVAALLPQALAAVADDGAVLLWAWSRLDFDSSYIRGMSVCPERQTQTQRERDRQTMSQAKWFCPHEIQIKVCFALWPCLVSIRGIIHATRG